jgi:hypothetical protein
MKKSQKLRNERLKPFGDLLYNMYEKTREILLAKTDDELKQIIVDVNELTTTNCGWTTYHIREVVAYEAKIILQNRSNGLEVTNDD